VLLFFVHISHSSWGHRNRKFVQKAETNWFECFLFSGEVDNMKGSLTSGLMSSIYTVR
jgi:hypothetical protein